jgi:hypothetical protein
MSQLKSVAVFVGANGIGKWQRIEISIFLQRFVGLSQDPCEIVPHSPERLEIS